MVSVVLLTTEEVLQRNRFWYCLDTVWVTEEMEPFEDIQPKDFFSKPLSRDFYYAKFPDIPRSDSEDESPISLNGFKLKHREWKSKVCVKRFHAKRKSSTNLNSTSTSGNNLSFSSVRSRRNSSTADHSETRPDSDKANTSSDKRAHDFFQRILDNTPPPTVKYIQKADSHSLMEIQNENKDLDDIDLPDYVDFEQNKLIQVNFDHSSATTSTLKRTKRRVSFNMDSFVDESEQRGCESVLDVSYLDQNIIDINTDTEISERTGSWSEIMDEYCVGDSLRRSKESIISTEI